MRRPHLSISFEPLEFERLERAAKEAGEPANHHVRRLALAGLGIAYPGPCRKGFGSIIDARIAGKKGSKPGQPRPERRKKDVKHEDS